MMFSISSCPCHPCPFFRLPQSLMPILLYGHRFSLVILSLVSGKKLYPLLIDVPRMSLLVWVLLVSCVVKKKFLLSLPFDFKQCNQKHHPYADAISFSCGCTIFDYFVLVVKRTNKLTSTHTNDRSILREQTNKRIGKSWQSIPFHLFLFPLFFRYPF